MKTSPKPKILKPADIRKWLSPRQPFSHKGDYGHVLILAGSKGMSGAAVLAAKGALRSGAGLVTVATPASQQPIVAGHVAECMTLPLPETREGTISLDALEQIQNKANQKNFTSVLIGPGLSTHPDTVAFVHAFLKYCPLPTVVDADALNAYTASSNLDLKIRSLSEGAPPLVLTPHPGELARILGISVREVMKDRARRAMEAAKAAGAVCVLKGHGTCITDGSVLYRNPTGNPGMATGGSGDVLSGAMAAWIRQVSPDAKLQERLLRAAALSVYLHGLAGDLAAKETGAVGITASDLADTLPKAYRALKVK